MSLRHSPLYDVHGERGASFTDFGGWDMPVEFSSIREEHEAVRNDVGIFDVSHMSQLEVSGDGGFELCQRLTTNDVGALSPGDAHYTTITKTDGTIIDDAILYRLSEDRYLLVPNAGKDAFMTDRWTEHRDNWDLEAEVVNQTEDFGMLAVQGPNAAAAIPAEIDEIPPMGIQQVSIDGVTCWCAQTGYTGEDGYEILAPWEETQTVDAAIEGEPCGLGSRDTLRLEMGYVLAGNEFDQAENRRTPLEARLGFVVDLDATPTFVGHEALVEQQEAGPAVRLTGIKLLDRGVPRHGYDITDGEGTGIGMVTSGTMSPTLGEAIGLGYVETAYTEPETEVAIRIRGEEKKARIETPPFLGAER